MSNSLSLLRALEADIRFSKIAHEAVSLIGKSSKVVEHSTEQKHSSGSIASMHELREKMRYYKEGAVVGMSETIVSLRERETEVWLRLIETERGAVAMWLINSEIPPIGLIVTKFNMTTKD